MISGFELPTGICIDGTEYAVNTDFRVWIEISHLLSEKRTDAKKRAERILILAYKNKLPPTIDDALAGINEFYAAGNKTKGDSGDLPVLDLYDDFPMIAAGFLHDYGVDLWCEKMHWYKFRALFSCLSEENKIIKVMGYRTVNLTDITDKKQRKFYKKMKNLYRLEDRRSEEEKEAYFTEKLSEVFEEAK